MPGLKTQSPRYPPKNTKWGNHPIDRTRGCDIPATLWKTPSIMHSPPEHCSIRRGKDSRTPRTAWKTHFRFRGVADERKIDISLGVNFGTTQKSEIQPTTRRKIKNISQTKYRTCLMVELRSSGSRRQFEWMRIHPPGDIEVSQLRCKGHPGQSNCRQGQ